MQPSSPFPLVVDLDGTLLATDSLWEGFVRMLLRAPWKVFFLPLWLLRGRLYIKMQLASYSVEASEFFPLRNSVLTEIKLAQQSGRRVYLATASLVTVAEKISQSLGARGVNFDGVFASTPDINLKGAAKEKALVAVFGKNGFDYIGDSTADLAVWTSANEALIVGNNAEALRARLCVEAGHNLCSIRLLDMEKATLKTYLKAIRIHQWTKNLLIFVPVLLAHALSIYALSMAILAYLTFCCCASSVYLLNDLLDLTSDRQHEQKRLRPFAAGFIPIWKALILTGCFLVITIFLCFFLPLNFSFVLIIYYILTCAYSFFLKRLLMLDVIILSFLYCSRLFAGAAAISAGLSHWLIAFCLFFFLALALLKRFAEFRQNTIFSPGRAYIKDDALILGMLSACCAFSGAVVMVLYIDSIQASMMYTTPLLLWLLWPITIYIYGRLLLITNRGNILDDPVEYVIKDKACLICAAIAVGILLAAI